VAPDYPELTVVLLAILAPVAWWLAGLLLQGAKPRSARLSFQRPLLGRWSTWLSGLRALASHGPDAFLSRRSRPHSCPLPARCAADLESAERDPRSDWPHPLWSASPVLAAIEVAPNLGAFVAGLELMVFTALFTIGALLVLNWIIKTMRSSD